MNVFVLHPCPRTSAQLLCDRHVVKMTLETAQILSTAAILEHPTWIKFTTPPGTAPAQSLGPRLYRPTHKAHPCVLAAQQDPFYRRWVYLHGIALADEYQFRYGRVHDSRAVTDHPLLQQWCTAPLWTSRWLAISQYWPQAMPAQYQRRDSNGSKGRVCEAYRAYYKGEKVAQGWCKWDTGRRVRPPIFD